MEISKKKIWSFKIETGYLENKRDIDSSLDYFVEHTLVYQIKTLNLKCIKELLKYAVLK